MSTSWWQSLLLGVFVVACDYPRPPDVPDDDVPGEAGVPIDTSSGPAVDGPPIDGRPVLSLDCTTYCTTIRNNCTGANAQYTEDNHCLGTCNKFARGTSSDTGGQNTLGCRLYHAQSAGFGMPGVECPQAGPAGAAISTANPQPAMCGDACTSFCTLEISICGSLDAPLTGIPAQYENMADCMTKCGGATTGFDKSKPYSVNSIGDSLACRLQRLTDAIAFAGNTPNYCPYTSPSGGMNQGNCMAGTPPGP